MGNSSAGASNVAGGSASRKSTENKEIDPDNVVQDPLGVAARVNAGNSKRTMSSGGSGVLVVEDLRTVQLIRLAPPIDVPTEVAARAPNRGGTCEEGWCS